MAQLKDLIVTGNSSFGGNVILDHAPTTNLEAATKKYVDDAIPSNNITGSGTSGYLTKWNGTNIITDGPQLGSNTTTFLRNDGTWAAPAGQVIYYFTGDIVDTVDGQPAQGIIISGTLDAGTIMDIINKSDGQQIVICDEDYLLSGTVSEEQTHFLVNSTKSNDEDEEYEIWALSISYVFHGKKTTTAETFEIYELPVPGHTHGQISNSGTIADINNTITTNDALLIRKGSGVNNSKIYSSAIKFDTTNTTDYLRKDGTWATPAGGTAMVVLTYGTSTWNDFLTAYTNNAIVYCAVDGSSSFPGSKRMAFLAYYNPDDSAEFQYVRSVSSLSSSNLSDQVFIYKLTPNDTWTTTTRSLHGKVSAGTAITVTPSGDTVTVAHTDTSSQASVSNSGRTYIQSITLDDFGHVTELSSATETVTIPANNITGSGTSSSLAKFSGTNTLTDGPAFNTSATAGKYLSETGSWTRPLNGIFKGTCSTPAATTTKVVVCPEFTSADLVAGAVVFVTFTTTNSGAVASLNLNVNSTGAKRLKYMRNAAESDLPGVGYLRANMTYRFVYTGSVWVCDTDYDANTYLDVPRIRNLTVDSNAGSLYRYELCMFTGDNTIMPYNKTSNAPTTYTKAVNTCAFDPFRNLVYYNTTTTISAGAVRADTNFCLVAPFDCRYSFNIQSDGTAGSTALTASLPVYIKAKYNIASKTATLTQNVSSSNYLERSGIVQVLPITDPNTGLDTSVEFYIYIFVGIAYSLYQICLFPNNKVYAWNASRSAMKEFDARGFMGASNSVTIGNVEYLLTRKPLTITDDGGTTTTYYIAELTAIQ